MTNDVEQIILENEKQKKLTYAENKAYMLYKEIWKFLFHINNEDFEKIRISFSYNRDNKYGYIDKDKGIVYKEFTNNCFVEYKNYYPGCTCLYVDILFNTNIDMKLFFKLISLDGFYYDYLDDTNPVLVCIDATKEQIDKKINEVLIKNYILKKEK